MVNSRQKGNNAELKVADMLHRITGESFVQTPGSGSGKIKGNLMVPQKIIYSQLRLNSIEIWHLITRYLLKKVIPSWVGGKN